MGEHTSGSTTTVADGSGEEGRDDGRTSRRVRNRVAVIDALVAFIDEGELEPGLDRVAARAGVSARSLFRYFDDAHDLTRAAIARQQERLAPLLAEPVPVAASTEERVAVAVGDRVHLLETMGAVARVARLRSHANPEVAAEVRSKRRVLRTRLAAALSPDLERSDDPAATLVALDVACSFEAYQVLLDDHEMSPDDAAGVMRRSVAAILSHSIGPSR